MASIYLGVQPSFVRNFMVLGISLCKKQIGNQHSPWRDRKRGDIKRRLACSKTVETISSQNDTTV